MFSPSPHSARLSERAHADWIGIESIENENGKLCSHNTASIETIETVETIETIYRDCRLSLARVRDCSLSALGSSERISSGSADSGTQDHYFLSLVSYSPPNLQISR